MLVLIQLFVALISSRFKSPRRLEIENLYLRHQLNIALRRPPHRLRLRGVDRCCPGLDDTALAKTARLNSRGSARHGPALASSRISSLLALEIARASGSARD